MPPIRLRRFLRSLPFGAAEGRASRSDMLERGPSIGLTSVAPAPPVASWRWVVLALLVVSTFLNYLDRQVLSVVKPLIKEEFALTDSHYSLLVAVFMGAYVVMYPVSGVLVDRFGSRRCLLAFVAIWSTATVFSGLGTGLFHLVLCRLVLGLAEPGNYPAALRTTAAWFPPSARGFPTSVFSAGSAIGAIAAPPLIAWIVHHHGWRAAFIVPGCVGGVWIVAWFWLYREPRAPHDASPRPVKPTWRELARHRALLGLVLARLISDPVWYFLLFWFPGYLQERLNLSLGEAGAIGWIPFLLADVGGIAAAAYSDRLVHRGRAPTQARFVVLLGVACLAPLACTLGWLEAHVALTVAVFSVLAFVCTTWLFTVTALIADTAPPAAIATVHGISGAFGALGALIFNGAIGRVVDAVGYTPVFIVAGFLHLAAALVLRLTLFPRSPAGS